MVRLRCDSVSTSCPGITDRASGQQIGRDAYRRRNESAYLRGDLEGMMGTSTEFPSRTEQIIDSRDQRFRERMRPWLERGNVAVFVGSAHMLNLRWMLKEDA